MSDQTCCHLEHKSGRVSYDQPDSPDESCYVGAYCRHPQALKTDQPMSPEDAAECERRGKGACWQGLP